MSRLLSSLENRNYHQQKNIQNEENIEQLKDIFSVHELAQLSKKFSLFYSKWKIYQKSFFFWCRYNSLNGKNDDEESEIILKMKAQNDKKYNDKKIEKEEKVMGKRRWMMFLFRFSGLWSANLLTFFLLPRIALVSFSPFCIFSLWNIMAIEWCS